MLSELSTATVTRRLLPAQSGAKLGIPDWHFDDAVGPSPSREVFTPAGP